MAGIMRTIRGVMGLWALAGALTALVAQGPPEPIGKAPALLPGEGLVVAFLDGSVRAQGDTIRESPMGGLARLVWMKLEGSTWSSSGRQFRCTGQAGTRVCTVAKGHGRVNVGKALAEGCELAFLDWIPQALARWEVDYGEGMAQQRLEEAFLPFLGRRKPPTAIPPAAIGSWIGEGDLLRTSPAQLLAWLLEPERSEVLTLARRFLSGFFVEFRDLLGKESWWFLPIQVPGVPEGATWVVAGHGQTLAVYRRTGPQPLQEGLARFKALLDAK